MERLSKLNAILSSIPEDVRMIFLNKSSQQKPKSGNVGKVIKILEALKDEEKKEFYIYAQETLDGICQSILTPSAKKGDEVVEIIPDGDE